MSENKTIARILVAIIAIPIILFVCFYGGFYFLTFVMIISLLGFYEFTLMLQKKSITVNKLVGFSSVLVLVLNSYLHFANFEYLMIGITLLVSLGGLRWKSGSPIADMGGTLLGILYIGLLFSSLIGIREFYNHSPEIYSNGGLLIIGILIAIWVCDSAAFFLGVAFGKHKVYPKVSPKKSWEGSISGFVFSVASFIALKYIMLDFLSWQSAILIGLAVGIFGQAGDFIESLYKRDSQVKDSSNIIPGHGGILDRFDSLLFSSPIIYLILLIFG